MPCDCSNFHRGKAWARSDPLPAFPLLAASVWPIPKHTPAQKSAALADNSGPAERTRLLLLARQAAPQPSLQSDPYRWRPVYRDRRPVLAAGGLIDWRGD